MGREQFYGAWRLVASETHGSDGTVESATGPGATGTIFYDPSGYMSVQTMRANRPALPTAGGPAEQVTALRAIVDGYIAYTGPYDVHEAEGYVMHHVECGVVPDWVGEARRRHYTFEGDRLILRSDPYEANGRQQTAVIIWQRLAPRAS